MRMIRWGLLWLSAAAVLVFFVATRSHAAWVNVAQEWQPYLDKMTPDQQNRMKGWFKGIRSPHGVPCCNMADGHKTLEDWRGQNEYWIPNPSALGAIEWMRVPPEAVVYNAGNPTGEAVVWYTMQGPNDVFIRCFVPGGGV